MKFYFDPQKTTGKSVTLKVKILNHADHLLGVTAKVNGKNIFLDDKPGIIDLYIWKHCASSSSAVNICGNEPKCNNCVIQAYCESRSLG